MKNVKGVVLALTAGFMVVFTLLGYATMHFAGFQGQGIEIKTASTKTFWLAEAGVQRAFSQLPGTLFNPTGFITLTQDSWGENKYTVTTALKPGFNHRWIIDATGRLELFRPIQSKIEAEVGPNVIQAFQTTGTLKKRSELQITPEGSYSVGRENFDYTFFGLFGTLSWSTPGVQKITKPKNDPDKTDEGEDLQDGIIWVDGDLKITNNGWQYQGILIVDGSFEMTGGGFTGIVWVNGSAKMVEGNPGVNGAIFINDFANYPGDGGETKIYSHSAWINYDPEAIDAAYDLLSDDTTPAATFRHILRWEEKS